jgi:N-acyl homoserine lactone hydrolase
VLSIQRLHLASLEGSDGREWPVHGFVVTGGPTAVLVDTGVGGPEEVLNDWRIVNRSVADALADIDMSPADIGLVVNTHLHFDHCGQNAVFRHAPFYVQRVELSRAERESPELRDWFSFMGARFELLDGDGEIFPGLSVLATPGHTSGHQCVIVDGREVLIGDAAYTSVLYARPDLVDRVPGAAADVPAWRSSLERVRAVGASRVHFCHDTGVVAGLCRSSPARASLALAASHSTSPT